MARQALEQQHYTANQIRVLEVQVSDMGEKLRTVQSLAGQTLRDSTDAYNQALNIYQQVPILFLTGFMKTKSGRFLCASTNFIGTQYFVICTPISIFLNSKKLQFSSKKGHF